MVEILQNSTTVVACVPDKYYFCKSFKRMMVPNVWFYRSGIEICDGVTMVPNRIGWYNLELGCICLIFSFHVAVKRKWFEVWMRKISICHWYLNSKNWLIVGLVFLQRSKNFKHVSAVKPRGWQCLFPLLCSLCIFQFHNNRCWALVFEILSLTRISLLKHCKKRKYEHENRTFQPEWVGKFAFTDNGGKPVCLICLASLKHCKTIILKHYHEANTNSLPLLSLTSRT